MASPLVTVICLCYNHRRFVREAITSVLQQTYPAIEVIVVDDHSTDGSADEIRSVLTGYPSIKFLALPENLGNCRAFNEGWKIAKGEYVVDFATDDIMLPYRIERQVRFFESHNDVGVVFTDAEYVDENGRVIREHFRHLKSHGLLRQIPEGDVYADVLKRYFICSPTMLVRRSVFEKLGGYDGDLAYEDFDFWVRSARYFQYGFLDEKLTRVRLLGNSLSKRWYLPGDPQIHSTYLVCMKAMALNKDQRENDALAERIRFEIRQCVFSENRKQAVLFYELLRTMRKPDLLSKLIMLLNRVHLPLSPLRRWYHKIRYS